MSIGGVIGGRYFVVGQLGEGWAGAVFLAEDSGAGRQVSLMILKPGLVSSAAAVDRYLERSRATSRLRSPHVARVTDAGRTEDGSVYLAMDLLRGGPLTDALRSRGSLDVGEALAIARQVSHALAAAHGSGLMHLCLSPDDIYVEWTGKGDVAACVLGFGVAELFFLDEDGEPSITHGGTVLGVPTYMSPEQARGDTEDEPRTDLYALGVILYEMLAGQPPFLADSSFALLVQHLGVPPAAFAELEPPVEVPEAVEALVMRLLQKDPAARFGSAEELVAALAELEPT
jgi:serine/threonine protein kinase